MRTTKSTPVKPNPMRVSRNKMQLGVFSTNTEGGCTVTNAPERIRGDDWAGILEIAKDADRAGFEAFIPVGRWKGFGGANNTVGVLRNLHLGGGHCRIDRSDRSVHHLALTHCAPSVCRQTGGYD